MTPEMTALVSRCRNRASSHRAMGFLEAGTDLMALAGLVESMDSELQVERNRRDMYRREAALACSAAQEALPLALGALEATVAIADKPLGVASAAFTGHLIGLAGIRRDLDGGAELVGGVLHAVPAGECAAVGDAALEPAGGDLDGAAEVVEGWGGLA